MKENARAIIGCAVSLAAAFAGASCGTSTACVANSSGVYVCDTYVSAYPVDYAYYDPMYATTWGYYPYYVDTYYDPAGTSYAYALPAAPVPVLDDAAGSNVPELLAKARRAANAVNVGVRAALDPINELIKTPPQQNGDAVVYGPVNFGSGAYQFTLRRLSESEQRFGWKLEARPASSSESFSQVAGGLIRVGDTPRRGRGAVGVDCGAMNAADSAVTCRGTLLIGFAHTDAGDKLLNVGLRGYTPDTSASMPLDARMFAWRHGDEANHVRLFARTNLSGTATSVEESVAIKLTWLKDVGVRADAAAAGGDIPQGQVMIVNSCVPGDLDKVNATTSARTCSSDGSGCTVAPGSMPLSCGAGLETAEEPNPDANASDPPAGMPEMPAEATAMPDGNGN